MRPWMAIGQLSPQPRAVDVAPKVPREAPVVVAENRMCAVPLRKPSEQPNHAPAFARDQSPPLRVDRARPRSTCCQATALAAPYARDPVGDDGHAR